MFKEDINIFFNANELADSAYISASATTVPGFYDAEFIEIHGIQAMQPVFTCTEIDAAFVVNGDLITINTNLISDLYIQNANDYMADGYIESDAFKVVGIQPDGTGLTRLVLEKQ